MTHLLALKNLTDRETFEVEPWGLKLSKPGFRSKEELLKWAIDRNTDWCFLSGWEGINPHFRVSRENEPLLLRALVVDYDVPQENPEVIQRMLSKAKYKPEWISKSFSGGIHAVFTLEKPVHVLNGEVREKFLKNLKKTLALGSLFPGLDEKFLMDCQTYLEVGSEWTKVEGGEPLPSSIVTDALAKAVEKSKFLSRENPAIPLEVIEKEVHERWPGRWTGPFVEGARGVRFWDPTADALSAVVKQTGMVCYTGNEGFVSWRKLFGEKFVEEYEANRTAGAIEEIYWDGREYWKRNTEGRWIGLRKEDLILQTKVDFGLSTLGVGGAPSEIDKAVRRIQDMGQIDAAVPFVMRPKGVIKVHGKKYLNTCETAALSPCEKEGVEGPVDFPWIDNFLGSFFDPDDQLDYFLAWLKRLYEGCLNTNPKQGHAVFIAGNTGQGKTLLTNELIAGMVGGHVDASQFLMGETSFNRELFHSALWTMDDTLAASDPRRQALYTSILKKLTANQEFEYHAKYKDTTMVRWCGRVVVTCNLDPESIRVLPNLDLSIEEKVSAFRVRTTTALERGFNGKDPVEIIRKELPAFCRWLLEWEYPEHTLGDPRYGVKNYIQKDLEETSKDSSEATQFYELTSLFLTEWKKLCMSETKWVGTIAKLHMDMSMVESLKMILSKYTLERLGLGMRKLASMHPKEFRFSRVGKFRMWEMDLPKI